MLFANQQVGKKVFSLTFFLDEKSKQKNQDARRHCGGSRTVPKSRPQLGCAEPGDPTLLFVHYAAWRRLLRLSLHSIVSKRSQYSNVLYSERPSKTKLT